MIVIIAARDAGARHARDAGRVIIPVRDAGTVIIEVITSIILMILVMTCLCQVLYTHVSSVPLDLA